MTTESKEKIYGKELAELLNELDKKQADEELTKKYFEQNEKLLKIVYENINTKYKERFISLLISMENELKKEEIELKLHNCMDNKNFTYHTALGYLEERYNPKEYEWKKFKQKI